MDIMVRNAFGAISPISSIGGSDNTSSVGDRDMYRDTTAVDFESFLPPEWQLNLQQHRRDASSNPVEYMAFTSSNNPFEEPMDTSGKNRGELMVPPGFDYSSSSGSEASFQLIPVNQDSMNADQGSLAMDNADFDFISEMMMTQQHDVEPFFAPAVDMNPNPTPSKKEMEIIRLVQELSKTNVPHNTFNQYGAGSANDVRKQNLVLYLNQMAQIKPTILLVGQAPVFQGSRLTGVPCTSEYFLLNPWVNEANIQLFGESRGYQKTVEFGRVIKEGMAKIVWESLAKVPQVPLLWDIYPFHTFADKSWQSNRKPTREEVATGEKFLREVIRIFEIKTVIALGKFVKGSLLKMGITCLEVRRPTYSNSKHFVQGIMDNLK